MPTRRLLGIYPTPDDDGKLVVQVYGTDPRVVDGTETYASVHADITVFDPDAQTALPPSLGALSFADIVGLIPALQAAAKQMNAHGGAQ